MAQQEVRLVVLEMDEEFLEVCAQYTREGWRLCPGITLFAVYTLIRPVEGEEATDEDDLDIDESQIVFVDSEGNH